MANGRIAIRVESAVGGRRRLAKRKHSFRGELGHKRIRFDSGRGNVVAGGVRQPGIRSERADTRTFNRGQCGSDTIVEALE